MIDFRTQVYSKNFLNYCSLQKEITGSVKFEFWALRWQLLRKFIYWIQFFFIFFHRFFFFLKELKIFYFKNCISFILFKFLNIFAFIFYLFQIAFFRSWHKCGRIFQITFKMCSQKNKEKSCRRLWINQ